MWADIAAHAWRHAEIAGAALILACAVGLPMGVLAAEGRGARTPILAAASIGRTLPSVALLTLMLPVLGVGLLPAVVALTILALPPIVVNADIALAGVAPAALDAATGLGMTAAQRFSRVSVPLALPVALAGIRTASVEVVGSATLATFVGAGGLGDDIVRALQTSDMPLLAASAVTVAAMAFGAELILARLANAWESN